MQISSVKLKFTALRQQKPYWRLLRLGMVLGLASLSVGYAAATDTARFTLSTSSNTLAPGSTGSQTITVTNAGPSTATSVVVTYTPPTTTGITVTSVSASPGGSCTLTNNKWICPSVASVALGGKVTLTVNMSLAFSVPLGTTAGSTTSVNSNEFNPGSGVGESLFNIWGAADTSAAAGDAFWFAFDGNYANTGNKVEAINNEISASWPPAQANPPGVYNLKADTASISFYTDPRQTGFSSPYGTTAPTTQPSPTVQSVVNSSPSLALAQLTNPAGTSAASQARDNRRVWEVRTGIYLNADAPLYVCVGQPDDGMYVAIDGAVVAKTNVWNSGVVNSSGATYTAGYHEIIYRIINRNDQATSWEAGAGGFASLGIGSTASGCTSSSYNTFTQVAPATNLTVAKSLPAPLSCTTMYGLTSSYTTMATNGTGGVLTPTDLIQEITTSGTAGSVIAKLPDIVSRNANNGTLRVDAYALGISPDRRYLFMATNSTNDTDKNAFYYYDTQTGTWSAPFPLAAGTDGAWQGPQRMVVTQGGIGYFSRNNYLYTFNANNPAAGIQGPFTMSTVYPNPQFPAPTPADINGGGDFVADTAGNLYVLSQPGTKDATNGNLIYDGLFDVFKITGSGSSYTATFLGRVTTTKQNNPMATWTGMAVLNNELYVMNNVGTMLKINLGNFETATVTTSGKQTSDLASCSYLTVTPKISSSKTVTDVNGGAVVVGDTLEYTITVRNTGNILLTNATFQDAIPAGTTYVPGSTTLNGSAVADVSGAMPYASARAINTPNQSSGVLLADGATSNAAVIKFRVTINAGTTSISNQGTVTTVETGTTKTDDPNTPTPDDATVTSVGRPDLNIVKTGPAFAKPSIAAQPNATPPVPASPQFITYTLKVGNVSGLASSGAVTVTDTLPAGLSATAISGTGWACTLSTLTCTRSDALAGGSSYPDITVTVQAPTDAQLETTPALRDFNNTATVSGGNDGNGDNNPSTANTKMVYAKLVKSTRNVTRNGSFDVKSAGLPGEVLEYCIDFTNYGGAALSNFTGTDSVPQNTSALLTGYDADEPSAATGFGIKLTRGAATSYYTSAADADLGTLTSTGGNFGRGLMTANLGTLQPGETGTACFRVTIR